MKSGLTDTIGDRVVYELIVQTPPVAPVLSIENITYTAIQLSWRGARFVKNITFNLTGMISIKLFFIKLLRNIQTQLIIHMI